MRAATIMRSEKEESGGLSSLKMEAVAPIPPDIIPLLTDWYETNKRPLPWRTDTNPYHIWVSEIMLQQTRVETVIPYYERFLKSLPDVQALSLCPEEELLKLWEGLGYYSRVRNMQKAAQAICSPEGFGGAFPSAFQDLLSLPGFGTYTAGAVASIAFGQKVPAVDGNALRVLSRLRSDGRPVDEDKTKKAVSAELLAVMEAEKEPYSPGEFNQAFMDLSALICHQNSVPECEKCPLKDLCRAHAVGTESSFPVKNPKKARRVTDLTILRIRDGERYLIDKRPAKGLLAGLWEFPNAAGRLSEKEALERVEALGLMPLHIERLPKAKHLFSHVEWRMTGYEIRVAAFEGKLQGREVLVTPEELDREYSMPSAFQAYRPE